MHDCQHGVYTDMMSTQLNYWHLLLEIFPCVHVNICLCFSFLNRADLMYYNYYSQQAVDWSKFGFDHRDGKQSTFWLGTKGAYTVCHYDTYGCNLVAQIYGRYASHYLLKPKYKYVLCGIFCTFPCKNESCYI